MVLTGGPDMKKIFGSLERIVDTMLNGIAFSNLGKVLRLKSFSYSHEDS